VVVWVVVFSISLGGVRLSTKKNPHSPSLIKHFPRLFSLFCNIFFSKTSNKKEATSPVVYPTLISVQQVIPFRPQQQQLKEKEIDGGLRVGSRFLVRWTRILGVLNTICDCLGCCFTGCCA